MNPFAHVTAQMPLMRVTIGAARGFVKTALLNSRVVLAKCLLFASLLAGGKFDEACLSGEPCEEEEAEDGGEEEA